MRWLSKNMLYLRLAALGLLILAILGPWYATRDGVPPPEWCTEQYHLLEDGRCVRYAPGTEIFYLLFSLFVGLFSFLVSQPSGRDLLVNLIYFQFTLLLLFPFVGFLILVLSPQAPVRRQHLFGAFAWGLGALSALAITLVEVSLSHPLLWGRLLFLLVCLGMGLVEVLLAQTRSTPAPPPA
jgi:hypothetical protein